jgi:uncharacterized protein YbjT (DUF2867 family)
MTFVVAGVSGNTGSVVADALLTAGEKVRVVVRDEGKGAPWRARGAEVAVADLTDSAALGRALAGASGAYLLIPPKVTASDLASYQDGVTAALAEAIARSKIPHVVFLSSVGAHVLAGNGPIDGVARAERAFAAIPSVRASFLRAAYFIENFAGSLGSLADGVITSFLPADLRFDMVATRDIGFLAASLLLEGPKSAGVIELGGPARSTREVAEVVGKIVGRDIGVAEAPLDAVVPVFTGFGMSASMAAAYDQMLRAVVAGKLGFEGGHRRLLAATPVDAVLKPLLSK